MADVMSTKVAASEVTGGHFIQLPGHIDAISGLMNEHSGLKFGTGDIWAY